MRSHPKGSVTKFDPLFVTLFRQQLLAWFDRAQRDLPWRRNPTPYSVAVSEFMLQQTQVSTVLPYFKHWMRKFPDWPTLANAPESSVLKAWEGLGYYRRARLLHALARKVVDLPGAELPADLEALQALPGIGPYTAGAIASIAFQLPVPAVDGNVERVLSRIFHEKEDLALPATRHRLAHLASGLVRNDRPGDFTQALMELGALVCLPRNPLCALCPVRNFCAQPDPAQVPRKTRASTTHESETLAWIDLGQEVLLRPPGSGPRWPDFWKLPLWDGSTMAPLRGAKSVRLTYGITRFRITATLQPARCLDGIPCGLRPVPLTSLPEILLPSPYRKLVRDLLGQHQAGLETGSMARAAND